MDRGGILVPSFTKVRTLRDDCGDPWRTERAREALAWVMHRQLFLTSRSQKHWGPGIKGRGLRWAERKVPGPAGSQREDSEGGLRGALSPDQIRLWEALRWDDYRQHFLTSGSQRDWECGERGEASVGRGETPVS